MKTILEFSDEETPEALAAMNASQWKAVVWDINECLRQRLKYVELPVVATKELEDARDSLFAILDRYGLVLE